MKEISGRWVGFPAEALSAGNATTGTTSYHQCENADRGPGRVANPGTNTSNQFAADVVPMKE